MQAISLVPLPRHDSVTHLPNIPPPPTPTASLFVLSFTLLLSVSQPAVSPSIPRYHWQPVTQTFLIVSVIGLFGREGGGKVSESPCENSSSLSAVIAHPAKELRDRVLASKED